MGLSAPKKRAKLSHDPNNTAWARNTESFGHKILSSQGWAPGQTLGAEGAAHATHYTAASNSHIRVLLKDDQLGLGASRGANNADTFGLSLFSGILGRLNGKTDVQLEKEQANQRDVELALYQSRKGGFVNFVSAGFLVGDRIDKAELMKKEDLERAKTEGKIPAPNKKGEIGTTDNAAEVDMSEEETDDNMSEKEADVDVSEKDDQLVKSRGTKRKRAGQDADTDVESASKIPDDKKVKLSKKANKEKKPSKQSSADAAVSKALKKSRKATTDDSSESGDDSVANKKQFKKAKKEKAGKASSAATPESEEHDRAAKKASKAERRAEKDKRRAEKDQRRAEKEERRRKKEAKRAAKSAANTPPAAVPFIGRHTVRQRYIAAKGRAHLDPQALKEIFMVKAA